MWATGDACKPQEPTCTRVPKFEVRFGRRIDVGDCKGTCKEGTCKPKGLSPQAVLGGTVLTVKECECASCAAVPDFTAIEVPTGACDGKCSTNQSPRTCTAGRSDNFNTNDGAEPSSPSAALLSGPMTMCSSGMQTGFDIFADNKCFGHTFSNCILRGPCPLKSATLNICLKAANVPLTSTDSLSLGSGGVMFWGIGLPNLNNFVSGRTSWLPGEQLCVELDLTKLPGNGANILASVYAGGELDVFVQDDTAVDFAELNVDYEDCQVCLPRFSVVSSLYTQRGSQHFVDVRDCGCFETNRCRRESHFQTFYPNTIFEATIDVGQCVGGCGSQSRCRPTSSTRREVRAPEGTRVVQAINSCTCTPLANV